MAKAISINVPKPCQENWAAMSSAEKGRFCSACQKTVRDFTRATDREIAAELRNGVACGRFLTTQLNRELVIPQQKSSLWLAASAAVMGFLALGTATATAQNNVPTAQQIPSREKASQNPITRSITISGIVKDTIDVLPGVSVILKGKSISTQTNIDGKFTIEAMPGDVLEFNFIGLKTVETTIGDSSQINVTLVEETENITIGVILTVRQALHKRIYYSVRDWFR